MPRWRLILCAFLLILAPDLANKWPLEDHAVGAQTVLGLTGPGGVIDFSGASVSCTNTVASCSLYNGQGIPAGLFATQGVANLTYTGVTGTVGVRGTPPLHLTLRGVLSTNGQGQIGVFNAGASFGPVLPNTTTASIALLNAHTPNLVGPGLATVPIQIDVWYLPMATAIGANAAAGGGNSGTLSGRVAYVATSGTETVVNSFVIGTTNNSLPADLNVEWRWGSASSTNALTIYNRTLQIGN